MYLKTLPSIKAFLDSTGEGQQIDVYLLLTPVVTLIGGAVKVR